MMTGRLIAKPYRWMAFVVAMLALAVGLGFGMAKATQVPATPQSAFFAALRDLCGRAFEGRVVSNDAADREMAA